jgi:hypothetical protein
MSPQPPRTVPPRNKVGLEEGRVNGSGGTRPKQSPKHTANINFVALLDCFVGIVVVFLV